MPKTNDNQGLTRRRFLGAMALVMTGSLAGCSSLRILMKAYPHRFDDDPELRRRLLMGFIDTIVPGSAPANAEASRVFGDDFYSFHEYCGYFLSDLAGTTRDLFGHENFDRLDRAGRTAVVSIGARRDGPVGRLYGSAIFMAQFAFYAGIYDDEGGCSLIDFPGANTGFRPNLMTAAEIEGHLAASQTVDGNPA